MVSVLLRVRGIVQGVGFRPFAYRAAAKLGLSGYVRNSGTDVEIFLQGGSAGIREFISLIEKAQPPVRIDNIEKKQAPARELSGFTIIESDSKPADSPIPPDHAICGDCAHELEDQEDRRFSYEFTNCTVCGPRFSVLDSPPFDRGNTSLRNFPKCPECEKEYSSPEGRRFYSQTNCCNSCGPHYSLYYRENLLHENPVKSAARLLERGSAVVIKGWGGMHVAVDATNGSAVQDLRKKLLRPSQPFAVMARDLVQARKCARLGKKEEELLISPERPIVVADKKRLISDSVSHLHNVGVMLPHSALHVLLFRQIDFPLVFTSANVSGLPMETDNESVRTLPFLHFLMHNLEIANRVDDSVVRLVGSRPVFLRRSRGFAPLSVPVSSKATVLALGAEFNNTACLLSGGAHLTQHIGNCTSLEVMDFLRRSIDRLLRWKAARPKRIACDLHPNFPTTKLAREYAQRFGAELFQVQHHEAHMAGVMAEHGLSEAVGIICDGTGYGTRGVSWGGEVFYAGGDSIERRGHLEEVPMLGGDLSAIDPRRMLAGFLHGSMGRGEFREFLSRKFGGHEIRPILKQVKDSPKTSSAGRFLDAVSALLGVCSRRTYEGEPAMLLESFALKAKRPRRIGYSVKGNVVDTPAIMRQLARSFIKDGSRPHARRLAYSAQEALASSLFEVALSVSEREGCRNLVVGGGVFCNGHISRTIASLCRKSGLGFYRNVLVPCGDGGVSFGQACFADRIAK